MSDELDPAVVKTTQNTLGKYVRKPNLTEKLLKKPPFRFLHDVFRVIIRDTGCFVGLYTLEELTFDNIKGREDKMKFLQKMIDVVKLTTGSTLAIKTSKIVAGHEPEKTNKLLQLMAEIIENKLDWQTSVEQVVSGKVERKESPRKPKDTTNKVVKDATAKEKSKEKESRKKETKTTKAPANQIPTPTSKDEKTKINKVKEKTAGKLVTKEITTNKRSENSVKNPGTKATNLKPKLRKTESQSSNKSSPQSNQRELKNNHEKKDEESEIPKTFTPTRKLSSNSENNEVLNVNNVFTESQRDSSLSFSNLEQESLAAEKSKTSFDKSRKLKGRKTTEDAAEGVDDKEKKINLQMTKSVKSSQEKSEISEPDTNPFLKQDSFSSTTNREQQQIAKLSESDDPLKKNQQDAQKSPPNSTVSEMKRESTFVREDSKESNKSSLVNRPRTSLRPPSARPPSARPGAPRRRDKNIEIILQPNDQIKMSGIQVKLETFGDLDDDGENLVIIENPDANDVTVAHQSELAESEKLTQSEALEQGHLVQQILETQKELVQQQSDESSQQKNYKDSTNNSVMRQTSARNMNNLRDVIQNLTKAINPLGKLMDFIPEDIDAMQLEFTLWRDAYTQAANELRRERSHTESAIEPMKTQLVQIEADIAEHVEMINASRVKILQNSEKLNKMLTTP